MDRFPIGFWNYVDIDRQDASAVRDWADAGVTLTQGPYYTGSPEHVKKMRAILDACEAEGIKLVLVDDRTHWLTLEKGDEASFRRGVAEAVEQLGDHPATFGFFVGDEPVKANFEHACRAMHILKELAPHLSPMLNLLPWHPGVDKHVGHARWSDYLDAYCEQARPDFLCYDCYSQMNPGTEGFEMYFYNLRQYWEAARRHGIPYWTTLLSVGHYRYRCPNEDDIRWQVNTALAHGAKGLLWFFFYMREPHENYRVSPIDEHGERTETYHWLSRVCRTFLNTHAPMMRQLSLKRVSHVGQVWGGWQEFDGTGRVIHVGPSHGVPVIVSEFEGPDGAAYVALVNSSQRDCTQCEVQVRGDHPELFRVGWEGKEQAVQSSSGNDFVYTWAWLAPGQMELYRVAESSRQP